MTLDPAELEARRTRVHGALAGAAPGRNLPATLAAEAVALARDALAAGHSELAVKTLELLVAASPRDAGAWQRLGFAYGEEQRLPDAVRAFAQAAALEPRDARSAFALARSTLDAGLAASRLFAHAVALDPGNLQAVNGLAESLAAEGDLVAAEALLAQTLERHPDWLAGHKSLAALRFTAGDSQNFARGYAAACRRQPQHLPLRLAWFSELAQAHDWEAALAIIAEGEALMGMRPAFAAARTFVACESGDRQRAAAPIAATAAIQDDFSRMAGLRHCLRTGQLERAESLAMESLQGPSAAMIWPYLSLIWRLRGDARARWLDGDPPYIRVFDLEFSGSELEALAAVLRRLHVARGPYLEQSVRGGTQTDTNRQLFFRAEPELQKVRDKVCAAIRGYVAALPPHVPDHPLLGVPRGRIRFSGSWSVRLRAQGFHVSHTHPNGWISSALYISLPAPQQLGAAPAGWIRFGVPPTALDLSLPAYAQIEPKPGRLVLFPSTMWHETLPFDDGERLVIAFDVMRPRPGSPG
jgi:Tfp pilus assembly protein PilF